MSTTLDKFIENSVVEKTLKYFNLVGFMKLPNSHRTYYLSSAMFHLTFTFVYLFAMVVNVILELDINGLFIVLTDLGTIPKMISFMVKSETIMARFEALKSDYQFSLRSTEEVKLFVKVFRVHSIFVKAFVTFGLCASVLLGFPVIMYSVPTTPYPTWLPFELKEKDYRYYLVFVYQNFTLMMHCVLNMAWDSFMLFFMVAVQTQIKVISHRLRTTLNNDKSEAETNEDLVDIFQHYHRIDL